MAFRFARALRAAFCVLAATTMTYAPACSDDHHDDGATGPTDAVYEGTATDEGLSNLEGLETKTDVARAPLITSPTNGAKVQSASAPTFTWKATPTATLPPSRRSQNTRFAMGAPFGPMRSAHAHGTPMNGKAFLLVFKNASGATVLRVLTTNATYQPTADKFGKLKEAKTALTLSIAGASYDNNNVVQGSGPFVGEPVSFTLDP